MSGILGGLVGSLKGISKPSTVTYLVVAGGGSFRTAATVAGGGGAGGYRTSTMSVSPGTSYTVTIGGGASPGTLNGSNSTFHTITSTGGGAGGSLSTIANANGVSGGSVILYSSVG